ncbi:MAG TPA: KH domain-containing protein [Candidatus Dependentiae bacterium]|nr:KH domain-containing protein [Candidatus Dependentiae bacterium]HRQ62278.1 KH domain-containing protein [Candidatus Dependentiae bacterium]
MKDLVEHIVKELVTQPNAVSVEMDESDTASITLKVHVHDADRGRVIGKEGKTIKAIRTLLHVILPDTKRVTVEII